MRRSTERYVSYMSDGASAWVDVPTLFTANSDATTLVTNELPPVVVARNIRIRPWTWNDDRIVLRWELNGRVGKLNHLIGFGTDTNLARFIREWTTLNLVNRARLVSSLSVHKLPHGLFRNQRILKSGVYQITILLTETIA